MIDKLQGQTSSEVTQKIIENNTNLSFAKCGKNF